ncbi:MAG: carbohydrate kinase family protein [Brevirhabdus sp.]
MILCAGEALIDMLPRVCKTGEPGFAPHAGGAVYNTAIALGRLGRDTSLFTGISNDLFGEVLREGLAASNVDQRHAAVSARPTTLAFVTLTDGQARYAFYDENTAGRMLSATDLPVLDDTVNALFFGGISLAVAPCADAYEALMTRESPARVTMIDPNIRPGFITDEPAYRARIDRMMRQADIVKLSDEDLEWLMGAGEARHKARELLAMGPRAVFITEGAKGAFAVAKGLEAEVAAQKVTVVDTVGAGDTFNAGILAALDGMGKLTKHALANLCEEELLAALSLGARAAAVTVSRAGANPPWMEELA